MVFSLGDRMTTWRPDTCKCIIEYDKNLSLLRADRCIEHSNIPDSKLLDEVLSENRRKNFGYYVVLSTLSDIPYDEISEKVEQKADEILSRLFHIDHETAEKINNPTAQQLIELSRSLAESELGLSRSDYKWEFDEHRVLKITLPQEKKSQKNKVQQALKNRFGADKVEVV